MFQLCTTGLKVNKWDVLEVRFYFNMMHFGKVEKN